MKKVLALVVAMVMAVAVLAGCGGSGGGQATTAAPAPQGGGEQTTAAPSGGSETSDLANLGLTFATNDFGQGEYSLDINAWIIESVAKHVGSKVDVVDNQFTVDNIITMLRSQLSKNPSGVCMIGIAETVYPAIQQACDEAKVPYSFFATPPVEEDVAAMEDDELYAGTVLFDPEAEAAYLAEKAYEAGGRKAVLLAGAQGDYNHDHRITGFTKRFEELGGEVLDYARCDNPGQGDEKGSNLLSANKDADVAVGMGAGYITSLEGIRDKMGLDYKIYGCDTTPNLIQDVIDGKVEIISCGANTGAGFATILLINKILGHPILDERGKAPFTKALSLYFCDASNCENFQKFWDECQRDPLTQEEVMALIGPNVTYDQFVKALENHAEDTYAKIATYGEGGGAAAPAEETTAASADAAPAPAAAEGPEYTFGTNIWGSGSYVLESQVTTANVNFQGTFVNMKSISNDFTADKLVQDAQTLISDGVDAVLYSCNAQPTFIPIAQICEQNKVPFVYYDKLPADASVQEALDKMEYYVGNIVCSNEDFGAQIAEIALKDGNKTALIVRAAAGDDSHDTREKGFREAFEAGGGTILGVTNCADPSEAVTKSNDIITANPDADCIYALGTDFAIGTLNAIESRNDDSKNMKVYTSDFTPDAARDVMAGKLAALNGGQLEESTIAAILAANWLDGHPILTPEGGKPLFNQMKPVIIDASNAQDYIDKTEAGEPIIPQEEYQKLMWRYNPDVTYETFVEFLENYADIYAAGISR